MRDVHFDKCLAVVSSSIVYNAELIVPQVHSHPIASHPVVLRTRNWD